MSGTLTTPRVISDVTIGIDWQGAEGEAFPVTPYAPKQYISCQNASRDPDPTYIQPDGTHGSQFRRFDGTRITTQAFKKELTIWGSKHQMLPFLESAMCGQPVASAANLSVSGNASANISGLKLTGIRPYHNASAFKTLPTTKSKVWLKLTEVGGSGSGYPISLQMYRDSSLTDLVASGGATVSGANTLAEKNNSGLSVNVNLVGTSSNSVEATIDKIHFYFATQYARFFRLYYSDGSKSFVLGDCVVQSMMLNSSESEELLATVSIMARRRQVSGVSISVSGTELDLVPYSHSELTLTKEPTGGTTPVLTDFELQIENNTAQYLGNAPTPQKLIKQGFVNLRGAFSGRQGDELEEFITLARANTAPGGGFITTLRADYLLGGNTTRFDMRRVRVRLTEPGISGEETEEPTLEYESHYDGATPPLAVSLDL